MHPHDTPETRAHQGASTREAIVAGIFYPATQNELAEKIHTLLQVAQPCVEHCPIIISPHGSLDYSGNIAALAWKSADLGDIDTIAIVGPSHRRFEKGIFLPESDRFTIPTGAFQVDTDLVAALSHSNTEILLDDIPHLEEHAIEMQLIFAAELAPQARILPVIISPARREDAKSLRYRDPVVDDFFRILGGSIQHLERKTALILSANMAVDKSAQTCAACTQEITNAILASDADRIARDSTNHGSFCGSAILSSFIRSDLARGLKPWLLGTSTSQEKADLGEPVVGYSAFGYGRIPPSGSGS